MFIEVVRRIGVEVNSFKAEVFQKMRDKGTTVFDIIPVSTELLGGVLMDKHDYWKSFGREKLDPITAIASGVLLGWTDILRAPAVFGQNALEVARDRMARRAQVNG